MFSPCPCVQSRDARQCYLPLCQTIRTTRLDICTQIGCLFQTRFLTIFFLLFDCKRMQQDVVSAAGHQYRISAGGRSDLEGRRSRRVNEKKEERALELMRCPFLNEEKIDEEKIDTPLACSKREFIQPRLRKCSFELDSIHFVERVGGGLDGYNWKIQVPKGGPTYVLKLVC